MIIDSHVHLFPPRVFDAIWRWFDRHAWNIRYRLYAERGPRAHARARRRPRRRPLLLARPRDGARRSTPSWPSSPAPIPSSSPLGTVLPGEPDAAAIVDEALRLGLRGFKIHCHVQKLGPDDPRLDPVYARAAAAGVPVVIHAGREPCLAAYGVDIHAICSAAATRRALERHPTLTMIVPHLGDDEEGAYFALLDDFPNLHLDTTMVVGEYFDGRIDPALLERHADRILYGTDFPNIPYEWDRELTWLRAHLSPGAREKILGRNAARLFSVGHRLKQRQRRLSSEIATVESQARETIPTHSVAQHAIHSLSTVAVLFHSRSQLCPQPCPQTQVLNNIQRKNFSRFSARGTTLAK